DPLPVCTAHRDQYTPCNEKGHESAPRTEKGEAEQEDDGRKPDGKSLELSDLLVTETQAQQQQAGHRQEIKGKTHEEGRAQFVDEEDIESPRTLDRPLDDDHLDDTRNDA